MNIDVGTKLSNGLFVVEPWDNYDHPDCWWVGCGHGHRIFATNEQIEAGIVACTDCVREAQQHATRQERAKLADALLNSGNECTDAYELIIAAERAERESNA